MQAVWTGITVPLVPLLVSTYSVVPSSTLASSLAGLCTIRNTSPMCEQCMYSWVHLEKLKKLNDFQNRNIRIKCVCSGAGNSVPSISCVGILLALLATAYA